ncbi:precorrin-6y C5,15-methyltransferase (decarboxylating) subunit CbiE [Nocardioides sp.]|uniref:precorrin-6y C5,15-methyltransferase (decarboxylating) subunit CbiE n=1 Tax=Nocardioides sp. TaxID=35761 RepID=UPI002BFCC0C3|nr:precorrin-6y C5,15-methyltransferase (decarboxylating) subunit CbiE [Nocardioides sp.]HXH79455.1 precorrin-6y C5,15-methyltransferase (decarboxylating) subunit CbiE [Nocardioides sp.]
MPDSPHPAPLPLVTVVGIAAGGLGDLSDALRDLVLRAPVVLGGARHLDLLPDVPGQRRLPWPTPLRAGLPALLASLGERSVVALASGDPLLSGVGTTLIDVLGGDRVVIHPGVSSVALARARLGWADESCAVVSLVGRHPALVLRELAPGRRLLVLSSDEHTPGAVAGLLTQVGYAASLLHVLGNLGSSAESHVSGGAADWSHGSPRLNVLGLELRGPRLHGWTPGLPDDAFEHDGQLTKRDLRASALSRLAPVPGDHLWDVGAGAGSVGIEWMRAHPTCTATAVEADTSRADRISRNATRLGVPGLDVVTGTAPGALAGLRRPDAVFVGGGSTTPGLLDTCRSALPPGGRLVTHGVTLETEQLLAQAHGEHGGELTRIAVETAAPVGSFTGWTPARTVTQWVYTRGA